MNVQTPFRNRATLMECSDPMSICCFKYESPWLRLYDVDDDDDARTWWLYRKMGVLGSTNTDKHNYHHGLKNLDQLSQDRNISMEQSIVGWKRKTLFFMHDGCLEGIGQFLFMFSLFHVLIFFVNVVQREVMHFCPEDVEPKPKLVSPICYPEIQFIVSCKMGHLNDIIAFYDKQLSLFGLSNLSAVKKKKSKTFISW